MRRVSVEKAQVGMVLAREVYDWTGASVIIADKALDDSYLSLLKRIGVREIVIHDERVGDVIISPVIPEEVEGRAAVLLQRILDGNRGVTMENLELELPSVDLVVKTMIQNIQQTFIGDLNLEGCLSLKNYDYIHGVKVTALSLLIGQKAGYSYDNLVKLGESAFLQNIGYILVPQNTLVDPGPLTGEHFNNHRKHPEFGYQILCRCGSLDLSVSQAVYQHHERWDGSGYPQGLKGEAISHFSRIIAVADTYHALVSQRSWRQPCSPSEAARFIASRSRQPFDPAMVQIFLRSIPFCPTGTAVEMNTGEYGIVTDANIGHICRPVVRIICHDQDGLDLPQLYDIDLTDAKHQSQWVAEIGPEIPELSEEQKALLKAEIEASAVAMSSITVRQSPQDTSTADRFNTRKSQAPSFGRSHTTAKKMQHYRQMVERWKKGRRRA